MRIRKTLKMLWLLTVSLVIFGLAIFFNYLETGASENLIVKKFSLESPHINEEFSFVHLSDFHWDDAIQIQRISLKMMEKVIQQTNQLNPDFIFLTGDYVQKDWHSIHKFADLVQSFSAKYGVYAVLGNHDYFDKRATEIASALENVGIKVLRNNSFFPFGQDKGFEIAGFDDPRLPRQQLIDEAQTKIPRIILSHRPDRSSFLSTLPGDTIIQLSGHSHGGQICLPNLSNPDKGGYPILGIVHSFIKFLPDMLQQYLPKSVTGFVNVVDDWDVGRAGLHVLDKPNGDKFYLHTSGGLATHPPFRVFCPPEFSVFYLKPKQK